MREQPDFLIDIAGIEPRDAAPPADAALARRPWIGIRFDCCGVYARVYRPPSATAYEGRCPHCHRPVRVLIGRGGTTQRLFIAR